MKGVCQEQTSLMLAVSKREFDIRESKLREERDIYSLPIFHRA